MPFNSEHLENKFKRELGPHATSLLYIAVSGGCDSMTLLHLAYKFHKDIEVLHVNYKLRNEDSELDAQLVKDYCTNKKIPFHQLDYDLKSEIETEGGNLQNKARNIRYDFFKSHLAKQQNSKIALAHHQDDQLETFWIQMARGGGIRAMAGMQDENKQVIRPLLNSSKAAIRTYAELNNITWREDKSNAKNSYTRNIWRNVLLPEIKESIAHIDDSVHLLQKTFKNQTKQDELLCKKYKKIQGESFHLDPKEVKDFTSNQWIEFLNQLNIPLSLAESVLNLFLSENGKKIHIDDANCSYKGIWKEESGLYFAAAAEQESIPSLIINNVNTLPQQFSKTEIYLDAKKTLGDIKVRLWQQGDRIHPVGVPGSKLVSDILKDAKVPLRDKANCLVITDEQKLLCVVGYCIDRRAIATSPPALKVKIGSETK